MLYYIDHVEFSISYCFVLWMILKCNINCASYLTLFFFFKNARDLDKTQVVLLVADPQLQGWKDEPIFPFGNIIRWDSDR